MKTFLKTQKVLIDSLIILISFILKICDFKGVKYVSNTDNMCCLRAIIIAKKFEDNAPDKSKFCQIHYDKLEREVNQLAKELNLTNKQCDINDIKKIENKLRFYQINVVDRENKFIYSGKNLVQI
jgi:hypothetical protein